MYFCYFYPVGLDLDRRRRPWLSASLVGLMLVVFAWQRWFPFGLPVIPWELVFYVGGGRPWTAATALLLHAGWLHLLGNLVYLIAFLPALEDRLGRWGLVLVFLVTGIGGNLVHGLAAWQGWLGQGGLGILGASGAISGLLGFALVRIPHARVAVAYWVFAPLQGQNRAGRTLLPLPVAVVAWLLLQVANSLVASESGSQVSYPAHLGGFGLGLLLALALGGRVQGQADASLTRARRYLEAGQALAAAGAYAEYLERSPGDVGVTLEQARAMVMAGMRVRAVTLYQQVYRAGVAAGRWDLALEALAEGWRCAPALYLQTEELIMAAHRAEKAGRRDLAAQIYQTLVLGGRNHPAHERAWVRLVLLLHADPARREEARDWLARASREMPPGAWRDYLVREFTPRAAPGATPAAAPAARPAGPGS